MDPQKLSNVSHAFLVNNSPKNTIICGRSMSSTYKSSAQLSKKKHNVYYIFIINKWKTKEKHETLTVRGQNNLNFIKNTEIHKK
jgi:hypothetical protein